MEVRSKFKEDVWNFGNLNRIEDSKVFVQALVQLIKRIL